ERLLDRHDIAFPDVATHCGDATAQSGREALEPGQHGVLQAVGQHGQHVQLSVFTHRADDNHQITTTFQKCNFVDSREATWSRRSYSTLLAIQRSRMPRSASDVTSSLASTSVKVLPNQLHNQMAFVGFGMQGFGVVPVESLRGGGMVIAEGTAEAFGTDTQ